MFSKKDISCELSKLAQFEHIFVSRLLGLNVYCQEIHKVHCGERYLLQYKYGSPNTIMRLLKMSLYTCPEPGNTAHKFHVQHCGND